jgi:hypothetical protein
MTYSQSEWRCQTQPTSMASWLNKYIWVATRKVFGLMIHFQNANESPWTPPDDDAASWFTFRMPMSHHTETSPRNSFSNSRVASAMFVASWFTFRMPMSHHRKLSHYPINKTEKSVSTFTKLRPFLLYINSRSPIKLTVVEPTESISQSPRSPYHEDALDIQSKTNFRKPKETNVNLNHHLPYLAHLRF